MGGVGDSPPTLEAGGTGSGLRGARTFKVQEGKVPAPLSSSSAPSCLREWRVGVRVEVEVEVKGAGG